MFDLAETETVNVTIDPLLIIDLSALTAITGVLAADTETGEARRLYVQHSELQTRFPDAANPGDGVSHQAAEESGTFSPWKG